MEKPMRMVYWRELKWFVASKMIYWALCLMADEMSAETADAFAKLGDKIKNDPAFDVVPMRRA